MIIAREWRNRYFIRLALSYGMLAVLLIGAAGGYLFNRANRVMIDEMFKDSQHNLNNIKDYVENTFLQRYEDTFMSKVMTTVNRDSLDELQYLLEHDTEKDAYRITRFIYDMGAIASANDGMSGITVLLKKANYVIDEQYYYHTPANSPDYDFIRTLDETAPNRWTKRTKGSTGKEVLTYVYSLPYKSINKYALGYLYLDMDLDYMNKMIRQMTSSSQERLLIFDKDGRLVFQNQPGSDSSQRLVQDIVRENRSEPFVTKDTKEGSIVAYLPNRDSRNEWSYVLVKPVNSFLLTTDQFKNDILRGCLIVLVAGLLSSLFISNRFSLPLKRLVLRMGEQTRSSNVVHLLNGNVGDIDDITSLPTQCQYVAVYVKGAAGVRERFTNEFAGPSRAAGCDTVSVNAQSTAILFYRDSAEEEPVRAVRKEMERWLFETAGDRQIVVGIGHAAQTPEEVHRSWVNAAYASKYSFIFGCPAVVAYDDVKERRPQHVPFPFEPFSNALLAGDWRAALPMIDKFAEELAVADMSLESFEVNIMQFVMSLSGFIIDHGLQAEFPSSALFADVKKPTFAETVQRMKEICLPVATLFAQRATNGHTRMIHELKAYVDSHMEEDLSLDSLAAKAGLTPNYVSLLFREVLHTSVVDYINKVRLEKAAQLLQETRATVADIAAQSGYRNVPYFCTKFKAKYGITPIQYRQAAGGGKYIPAESSAAGE
ncbi:AraC family transcriptional regulator [Paenibacillus cymbidii]|uniref:AraC family transcriptional regulator n=1 Tax=Paenibacillus cymbidii TaxID=1639034 RepID=UPI001436A916|nr:AraC family transcriptional regulator [Paenibacillus cymbidii]